MTQSVNLSNRKADIVASPLENVLKKIWKILIVLLISVILIFAGVMYYFISTWIEQRIATDPADYESCFGIDAAHKNKDTSSKTGERSLNSNYSRKSSLTNSWSKSNYKEPFYYYETSTFIQFNPSSH